MIYDKRIVKAEFINRPNRFYSNVKLEGKEIKVHVPNTGRCKELLIPGCTVYLREENNPARKTPYDLIAVEKGHSLVSIDSHIPNKDVEEALQKGKIEKLKGYKNILREKMFEKSRFDFKLSNDESDEYYLEIKGVTLEDKGYARFPDAPTERGARHLMELIEAKRRGYGAGVLFLIQLEKVYKFSPNDETDYKFGEALRAAKVAGVDIFAYNCLVTEESIEINKEVEIIL